MVMEYGNQKLVEDSRPILRALASNPAWNRRDAKLQAPPVASIIEGDFSSSVDEIIGYARVSTADQAYQFALAQQVFRLRQAGATKVYADIASRSKDNRAALMEVMRLAATGRIKKVLVTRLDRLTSSPGLFERISEVFTLHNVILAALDETVDVHSVDGEFSAGLSVWFARREIRTISLRQKKAKEVGRQKNRASSSVPWGYRNIDGRYELDHTPYLCLLSDRPHKDVVSPGRTKAQLGRDIVDLFFEGGSLSQAARLVHMKYGIYKFNKAREERSSILVFDDDLVEFKPRINKRAGIFRWSPDGIRVYLLNPVLCGSTPYNTHSLKTKNRLPVSQWDVRYNTHPDQTLITHEEKQRIEKMMAWNGRGGRWGNGKTYPMTGLIVCSECGRGMKAQGKISGEFPILYYQCKNYVQRACPNRRMARLDSVEQAVTASLVQRAGSIAEYASTPPEYVEPEELQQLRSTLGRLEQLGHNSAIEAAKNDLRSQIQALEVKSKTENVVDEELRELLLDTFSDPEYWKELADDAKRQIYRDLVKLVAIRDGQVESVELRV